MKLALALLFLLLPLAGCPAEDACGPGDAAADGLLLTGSSLEVRYHEMTASPNNDCPDPSAPQGVISLTIAGVQVGGSDGLTLCVGRPDMLASGLPLGTGVQVVDVGAESGDCTITRNATPATGTVTADGICENGTDPAGFALSVQGQVSVDRDCSGTMDTLRLDLTGVISVATP